MERIPVLQKLLRAGELELVESESKPENKKEASEDEEVKEVLKNIKNKKK
jgi:hypothetical protein